MTAGKIDPSEITFTETRQADLERIDQLINRTTSGAMKCDGAKYYKHTYFGNPAGKGISMVAKHRDDIIAHFCILPRRYRIAGEDCNIGKTMDYFTDKRYQGMGLSTKILNAAFAEAGKRGIRFTFTTPSELSAPIFIGKYRFTEPFTFKEYWCLYDLKQVLKNRRGLSRISVLLNAPFVLRNRYLKMRGNKHSYRIDHFPSAPLDIDAFWNRVKSSYRITPVKDRDYLSWRYFHNPLGYEIYGFTAKQSLEGLLVLRITEVGGIKTGIVVDAVSDRGNRDVMNAMLQFSGEVFLSRGCALGFSWGTGSKSEKELWGKYFFKPILLGLIPGRITRRRILIRIDENAYDEKYLSNPDNWSFAIGDGNDY